MDSIAIVESMNLVHNKAFNEGNAEGCVALFSSDTIQMPPEHPMLQEKKRFLDFYQKIVHMYKGNKHSNNILEFISENEIDCQVPTCSIDEPHAKAFNKFVNVTQHQPGNSCKYTMPFYNLDKPASESIHPGRIL